MRALIIVMSILSVTADRAYNIDAMASTQSHALRTAARLLDPPPVPPPQLYAGVYLLDAAEVST